MGSWPLFWVLYEQRIIVPIASGGVVCARKAPDLLPLLEIFLLSFSPAAGRKSVGLISLLKKLSRNKEKTV